MYKRSNGRCPVIAGLQEENKTDRITRKNMRKIMFYDIKYLFIICWIETFTRIIILTFTSHQLLLISVREAHGEY